MKSFVWANISREQVARHFKEFLTQNTQIVGGNFKRLMIKLIKLPYVENWVTCFYIPYHFANNDYYFNKMILQLIMKI